MIFAIGLFSLECPAFALSNALVSCKSNRKSSDCSATPGCEYVSGLCKVMGTVEDLTNQFLTSSCGQPCSETFIADWFSDHCEEIAEVCPAGQVFLDTVFRKILAEEEFEEICLSE